MKYTRPLLVWIIAIIPLTIIFSVTASAGWVLLLFPVMAIVGTLVGFLLAPILLWLYKKVIGRNHVFAFHEKSSDAGAHGMFMGFFPALMATNFALSLIFNPVIMEFVLFQEYYLQWNGIIFLFFNLGAYLQAPAFAFFAAAWIIDDSGMITMDKDEATIETGPIELQVVGRWFLSFLKGYAGIGVVLALYQFTFEFLGTYGSQVHFSAVIFLIILPIITVLWVIPAIVLVNASHGVRQNYIMNIATRMGIKDEFEATITMIDTQDGL